MELTTLWHYIDIVFLGIIEGITEFLPISSTGHLLIAEAFGLGHQSDVFNVVIQAGAIAAVVLIYWPKILDLILSLNEKNSQVYLAKLVVATAITLGISLVVVKYGYKLPEKVAPVAIATLVGGFVILLVERISKAFYPRDEAGWFEAFVMGCAQVLAEIFPGTSRSGATIMAGLFLGVKRSVATEFSFLIGIPTMFAASGYELLKLYKEYKSTGALDLKGSTVHQVIIDTSLGFVVSAIVAFFVVKWLLRFVQSHTFNGFAYYRILLGGGLLLAMGMGYLKEVEAEPVKPVLKVVAPASVTTPEPPKIQNPTPPPVPVPQTNSVAQPSQPATNMVQQPTTLKAIPLDNPTIPVTNSTAVPVKTDTLVR